VKVWTADRSLRAIFATAIIAAIMVSFLPEDPGLRFQQLDNTEYRNLRWIYERTHLDPRAIDVAILGSSRIETGVDARRLEASFRAAGVPVNVENFGIRTMGAISTSRSRASCWRPSDRAYSSSVFPNARRSAPTSRTNTSRRPAISSARSSAETSIISPIWPISLTVI